MEKVTIKHKGKTIGKAICCDNIFSRGFGLMFRKRQMALIELPAESLAMAAIHTFFMRFPIDVYWLDSKKQIIGIKKHVRQYSFAQPGKPAKYIFEAPAGKLWLKMGEKLSF
ncbi:MAG: DUF192 domain-containing protein [Nanoarchaeota archaeon]|nr:DUF192 domain-containing protein [Nanoarchaeota archaeon]